MKAGITGLPYSGKSSLFCALTGQEYGSLSHGKDVHIGTVPVPDSRLDSLYDMFQPKKKTAATMEYFDVAGKVAGSGKGMDPQILQTLKNADSLIVVLDAYNDGSDPKADFNTVIEEFALTDLLVVTNRLERLEKELRASKSDALLTEKDVLGRCLETLENGGRLLDAELSDSESKLLRGFQFLTLKSLLIVLNVAEGDLGSDVPAEWEQRFSDVENAVCAAVCAEVEMEIAALEEEDRIDFLESMGIDEPALGRLIRMSYERLGLMSFFTAGGTDEVRAWTVRKGSTAPECAGAIHSDLQRGFIRAETVTFDDLMATGSFKDAREQGLLRVEGKDYIVQDGDILTIRFNV